MKATHNKSEGKKTEWKFPCVGVSFDGEVVGFTSYSVGTVLSNPSISRKLLDYVSDWNMQAFNPLPSTESVTLQND